MPAATGWAHGPGGLMSAPGMGGSKKRNGRCAICRKAEATETCKIGKMERPCCGKCGQRVRFVQSRTKAEDDAPYPNETAETETPPEHTGVMISFDLAYEDAQRLVVDAPGAERAEDLHITLAYLGDAEALLPHRQRLETAVRIFAAANQPIEGKVNGFGVFSPTESSDGKFVVYATYDSVALPQFRQRLVNLVKLAGVPFEPNHGFIPHITLMYSDGSTGGVAIPPSIPLKFDAINIHFGGEVMRFPLGRVAEKETAELKEGLSVFKDANGRYRWVAISSNAYRDRDGEIVSTKALEDDCERADKTKEYGPLRFWHMPGVDIGTCDFNMMHGRMLIESGTFKSEGIGLRVKEQADHYQLSIGFRHPADQPDRSGVYHNIRRFERSLVPAGRAANSFTSLHVKESNEMATTAEKMDAFKALLQDEDVFNQIIGRAEQTEKAADGMGIAFKDVDDLNDLKGDPAALLNYALKAFETAEAKKEAAKMDDSDTDDKEPELKMSDVMKKMAALETKMDNYFGKKPAEDEADKKTKEAIVESQEAIAERQKSLETAVQTKIAELESAMKELKEATAAFQALPQGLQVNGRPSQSDANVVPDAVAKKEQEPDDAEKMKALGDLGSFMHNAGFMHIGSNGQ